MGKPGTGRQLALAPLRGTESTAGSDSVVPWLRAMSRDGDVKIISMAMHDMI